MQSNVTTVLSMGTLLQTVRARKDAMYVLQNIMNGRILALQKDTAITVKAVIHPIRGNVHVVALNRR